ncbi:MAG: DUF6125 family protein [Dehalococcoidales bacterium]|nr:DUF6125 family protein [Dehalococcoidales bacterium]
MKLTDKQIADYFHRCFTAVDGLWFIKVEEKLGFEGALGIDRAVWEVFPSIQAREMKAMLGLGKSAEALRTAFTTALDLKGFTYRVENEGTGFRVVITQCPWHDTMVKSGRQHLSARVGEVICQTEYSVWAAEFGNTLRFSFESLHRLCSGAGTCVLCFKD